MAQWVRNAVVLVVLGVWAVVVIVSLARGIVPDAITWGVPGAVYFALNPSMPSRSPGPATTKPKGTGRP